MKSWQELIKTELFEKQLNDWPLARKNYACLDAVLSKTICFDDFEIRVQFNPERVRSVTAKMTPASDRNACILCPENRPSEQISIAYAPSYNILLNPFPIFAKHLTIPDTRHLPQQIRSRLADFLAMAKNLPDYSLLYNGPSCGASVPAHLHFQSIEREVLPIEKESAGKKALIRTDKSGSVYHFPDYLRKVFLLESNDVDWLCRTFGRIEDYHPEPDPALSEGFCFNILAQYNAPLWQLYIFPRSSHRPARFYEPEESRLLVSPGIVDMAGVLITVREDDYSRIDSETLRDIFRQVSISDKDETRIIKLIQNQ